MIYLHVLNRGARGVKSPMEDLDFDSWYGNLHIRYLKHPSEMLRAFSLSPEEEISSDGYAGMGIKLYGNGKRHNLAFLGDFLWQEA